MSGTVLSQDTYLNKDTPLSVIGGGGGGGSINSVSGLAPNIITATVAGAVTVGLTSSIAGISSIAFGGAYGNLTGVSTINGIPAAGTSASGSFSTIFMNPTTGNIQNAIEILGVSTMTGDGLQINFENTGPNTDPWGKVEYDASTMKMTTSINLAGGATSDAGVFVKPSTLSLSGTYTDGAASRGTNIDINPNSINIYGDSADAFNVTLGLGASLSAPALVNVSTINGAPLSTSKANDIPAVGADFSLPANVKTTVGMGLTTTLTAGRRYIYSPTVYISSSGAGGWPASAAGYCWLSGQTSEILGGPWSYSQLSTAKGSLNVSVIVPTSMFGTAGAASFSPSFSISADWPMNTILAVSSIQTTNPDFYATTLVDLGAVSSGP
jgi:hypothetical protein